MIKVMIPSAPVYIAFDTASGYDIIITVTSVQYFFSFYRELNKCCHVIKFSKHVNIDELEKRWVGEFFACEIYANVNHLYNKSDILNFFNIMAIDTNYNYMGELDKLRYNS